MKTRINTFGETVYTWQNNNHPDNVNFMQIVFWFAWQKTDGRYSIGYSLEPTGKVKMILWGTGDVKNAITKYL